MGGLTRKTGFTLLVVGVMAALLIGGCASGPTLPPEQQLVEDALEAMGGRERVLAVTTLTIEGDEGTTGNFGQNRGATGDNVSPSALLDYTREMDVAQHRMSERYTTERRFSFVLPLP